MATVLGTLAAMLVVPLRSLGPDGWKIAAALMARHIGGGQISCSCLGRSLCSLHSYHVINLIDDGLTIQEVVMYKQQYLGCVVNIFSFAC